MKYIITSTDLRCTDPALYNDCKSFMDPLQGIRSGMTKKVNKESAQTRHAFFPLMDYTSIFMAWFYGLGKFRKEPILTSGFVFSDIIYCICTLQSWI